LDGNALETCQSLRDRLWGRMTAVPGIHTVMVIAKHAPWRANLLGPRMSSRRVACEIETITMRQETGQWNG